MSKFNAKIKSSTKVSNLAGGIAYKHSPEMELVTSVLTTFLEDKFYETGDERMNRIEQLCAVVKDDFIGKLAVVARNEFHLRSVSHLLLKTLARKHRGDNLVGKVMKKIVERPDDLTEITTLLGKPIPKQVKKGIRQALLTFSPYQLAKYRMENRNVKLVDLFNIAHPNPEHATPEQQEAWKKLMNNELKNEKTWESKISATKGEGKGKVWKEMVAEKELGYFALIRNLSNLEKECDEKTLADVAKRISNREEVKRSKLLPFRFFSAYEHINSRILIDAVSQALDYSLDNVPHLGGKTLISVDGSGSMDGDPMKKASIFAAALYRATDSDMIVFSEDYAEVKATSGTPIIELMQKIKQAAPSGGTNTSLTFEYAEKTGKKYDRIIILSDNESWQDSGSFGFYVMNKIEERKGTNAAYNEYKKTNDCYVYAFDLAGYGTKDVAGSKVFHLAGWSEKIFSFMEYAEKGEALVDYVNSISLE